MAVVDSVSPSQLTAFWAGSSC